MPEWSNGHAWKACVPETVPWVRIPPCPRSQPCFSHKEGRDQRRRYPADSTRICLIAVPFGGTQVAKGLRGQRVCAPASVRPSRRIRAQIRTDNFNPIIGPALRGTPESSRLRDRREAPPLREEHSQTDSSKDPEPAPDADRAKKKAEREARREMSLFLSHSSKPIRPMGRITFLEPR